MSVAVAFVTEQGVRLLEQVVGESSSIQIDLTARAGGVTSPDALLRVRERFGAQVFVRIGRGADAYHPKLWLFRDAARLSVLSGSGNLTAGGLVGNTEQFEFLEYEQASDEAALHELRFDTLTEGAVSLDDLVGTAIWREWLDVVKRQRHYRAELERLETRLNTRAVAADRSADKSVLLADLEELYVRTVSARLPQKDGRSYVPSRFRQGIDRARLGADPVLLVTRICRRQSEGFDVILASNRPDLTVEAIVLDENKVYHDLFTEPTKRLSRARLDLFQSSASDRTLDAS